MKIHTRLIPLRVLLIGALIAAPAVANPAAMAATAAACPAVAADAGHSGCCGANANASTPQRPNDSDGSCPFSQGDCPCCPVQTARATLAVECPADIHVHMPLLATTSLSSEHCSPIGARDELIRPPIA